MTERITGYDTMLALLEWGNQQRKTVYLVGAKPEVIKDVKKVVANRYPGLKVQVLTMVLHRFFAHRPRHRR